MTGKILESTEQTETYSDQTCHTDTKLNRLRYDLLEEIFVIIKGMTVESNNTRINYNPIFQTLNNQTSAYMNYNICRKWYQLSY